MNDWLTASLEEYKSLRTESLESMKMQHQILGYGITATGILVALALSFLDETSEETSMLPGTIFLLVVPLFLYLVALMWAAEVSRMMRAGAFLAKKEREVNEYLATVDDPTCGRNPPSPALSWENWLATKQLDKKAPHEKLYIHYVAGALLFFVAAVAAVVVGSVILIDAAPMIAIVGIDLFQVTALLWTGRKMLRTAKAFHVIEAPQVPDAP